VCVLVVVVVSWWSKMRSGTARRPGRFTWRFLFAQAGQLPVADTLYSKAIEHDPTNAVRAALPPLAKASREASVDKTNRVLYVVRSRSHSSATAR
jgi:hypothetical protein